MYKPTNNFVIIDDDSCHNIVCALSLKRFFKSVNINITGFTNAQEGIEYLQNHISKSKEKIVLFLDINMPVLSGWDVLTMLDTMPEAIKKNLIVYMLSSLVTVSERARSFSFSFVKDCLEKPLSDHFIAISEELTETALAKKNNKKIACL